MIITAWLLLVALICCAQSFAPMPAAMAPSTSDSSPEENVSLPNKRILKYLLPPSQTWGDSGVDAPIPTGQEGTKRGYSDRNFLRFGRSEAEKRAGVNKNFLRFGRGDVEDYEDLDENSSLPPAEKRDRNFLRFGRDPGRNFLRFGRAGMDVYYGQESSPLEFARGLEDVQTEEEKRGLKNYLRFGRANKNFLRLGRTSNKNFLRFGRSVDTQTFCDDCEDENLGKQTSATSSSPASSSSSSSSSGLSTGNVEGNAKHMLSEDHSASEDVAPLVVTGRDAHRTKRSATNYYDYVVLPSHAPSAWANGIESSEEGIEDFDDLQEAVNKRSYNRNFLRFGRDRNFLRFGKRDSSDGSSGPIQYPRIIRAPSRNFLRFG